MIHDERGFASPVMLSLLVVAVFACLATADAANVLVAADRAQRAADAAALAAATEQWPFAGTHTDPATAATRLAQANGATFRSCDCPLRGTRAVVRVAVATRVRMLWVSPPSIEATAVASFDPSVMFRPP